MSYEFWEYRAERRLPGAECITCVELPLVPVTGSRFLIILLWRYPKHTPIAHVFQFLIVVDNYYNYYYGYCVCW